MVFGNMNPLSGCGVIYKRNPCDGAQEYYGRLMKHIVYTNEIYYLCRRVHAEFHWSWSHELQAISSVYQGPLIRVI